MGIYNADLHDIGIKDPVSGKTIGMMVTRNKNNAPDWLTYDDEYLAQQIYTDAGYGALPPEKEIAIRQDDWRAGFGEYIFDDPKRYYKTTNMDMRTKGMGKASPLLNTINKPDKTNTPLITNAGMELETGWVYNTDVTRSSTYKQAGTYSICLHVDDDETITTSQYLFGWTPGVEYTFTCYAMRTQSLGGTWATFKIGIDDGVTTTYSSASYSKTFVQLTATKTLSTSAKYMKLILWANIIGTGGGQESFNYFDTATIEAGSTATAITYSGVIVDSVAFNGNQYFTLGKYLCKLNSTGDTLLNGYVFDTEITDLEVFYDKLYIALGLDTDYYEMDSDAVFTAADSTEKKFKYFKSVYATTPVMWGVDGANTIRGNINPEAGGEEWSGQTEVGADFDEITALWTKQGSLYIRKEDTVWYLNEDGQPMNDFAPELEFITYADGDKNALVWLGKTYMPAGKTLLEEDSGVLTWRSPSKYCVGLPEFIGEIEALAGDEEWLYAAIHDNVNDCTQIVAGRTEVIDNYSQWVWHSILELTDIVNMEFMFISSVYEKRLYIASRDEADDLTYITLDEDALTYQTGGEMVTPQLHANFKNDTKAYVKLTVELGHDYDENIYIEAYYMKPQDSAWTDIGDFKGTATSRVESIYLPLDSSDAPASANNIQLKFVAVTDDDEKTPILKSYDLRAILYAPRRSIISTTVRCANHLTLKNGLIEESEFNSIKTTLDRCISATYPIEIIDPFGDTMSVKFLPLPSTTPRTFIFKSEKMREPELHYNLYLQTV
jgi:hypothetical protein